VRGKLAVVDRLVRLGIPHPRFVDVNAEACDCERYDDRHHGAGLFIRCIVEMLMEFLQIGHCFLPIDPPCGGVMLWRLHPERLFCRAAFENGAAPVIACFGVRRLVVFGHKMPSCDLFQLGVVTGLAQPGFQKSQLGARVQRRGQISGQKLAFAQTFGPGIGG
jgi:hypothetical protein